uniref:Uncharacterized protein n=1 Tax=Physcomitrium patens TaxID=3218 RepID=A0A2K1K7Z2_PHYPA|nr:hypothetical protein PHYPA_011788 [Physcomitrium patens]
MLIPKFCNSLDLIQSTPLKDPDPEKMKINVLLYQMNKTVLKPMKTIMKSFIIQQIKC